MVQEYTLGEQIQQGSIMHKSQPVIYLLDNFFNS